MSSNAWLGGFLLILLVFMPAEYRAQAQIEATGSVAAQSFKQLAPQRDRYEGEPRIAEATAAKLARQVGLSNVTTQTSVGFLRVLTRQPDLKLEQVRVQIAEITPPKRGNSEEQTVTAPGGVAVGGNIENSTINIVNEGSNVFFNLIAGFAPEGPMRRLVVVFEIVCVLGAVFIYRYYVGLLAEGSAPEGSLERRDYDRLRVSLAGDNLATSLYARWLSAFLDRVEQFFDDTGLASRTPFLPNFLRLRTAAPLWSGPALDRCLLLAFVYPAATIFLIWVISGFAGPAEAALTLQPNVAGWLRGLSLVAIGFAIFLFWRVGKRLPQFLGSLGGNKAASNMAAPRAEIFVMWSYTAFAIAALQYAAITIGSINFGVVAIGVIGATSLGLFIAFARRTAIAGIIAIAFASGLAFAGAVLRGVFDIATLAVIGAFAGVGSGAVAMALGVSGSKAIKNGWHGCFLALFFIIMILTFLIAPSVMASFHGWENFSRMLLFLGLFPLLNAPFDWFSVGLTRALLRRGLELKGLWPYFLAIVDASLAAIVVALLAIAMVVCVQSFNEAAVSSGGKTAVLPLDDLLAGIEQNPSAPQYWWIYVVLLSTMVPSLVNLAIGGMAMTRGLPWLGRSLLKWIPENRDVPRYKRPVSALLLTGQWFAGLFLGISAQTILIWIIILRLLPRFGLDLLDMANAVARFDVPTRTRQLFAGLLHI
jgi:hypothetical protein